MLELSLFGPLPLNSGCVFFHISFRNYFTKHFSKNSYCFKFLITKNFNFTNDALFATQILDNFTQKIFQNDLIIFVPFQFPVILSFNANFYLKLVDFVIIRRSNV